MYTSTVCDFATQHQCRDLYIVTSLVPNTTFDDIIDCPVNVYNGLQRKHSLG